MSRIDFPTHSDTHTSYDENGVATNWKRIRNSWVKQFAYAEEAPDDAKEYCRLSEAWSEIIYPIPADTGIDGLTYARSDNGWVQADFGAAGPAFTQALFPTPGLYGMDQATENWLLLNDSDLEANYYDKTISDGRFAAIVHAHDGTDPAVITGLDDLAFEADAPSNGNEYVRKDAAWAVKTEHAVPLLSNSISIIDPIASDDAILFYAPREVLISSVKVALRFSGSGSVYFNVFYASTADGSGGNVKQLFDTYVETTSIIGESVAPSVENLPTVTPTIPAGSYVWVVLDDSNPPSSSTTMFHLTAIYTET